MKMMKTIKKHKRFLALGMTCILAFGSIRTDGYGIDELKKLTAFAEEENAEEFSEVANKNGAEIVIEKPEDLIELAINCHEEGWSADKNVRLANDLDLTGYDFKYIPIFSGVFNGGGHLIKGYEFKEDDGYIIGFFRHLSERGIVENLNINGYLTTTNEKYCIGGIVGDNKGTIRSCSFQGIVDGKTETGAIAGINESTGLIQRCSSKGRVTGYYYTGGITGRNYGTIDNCTNYANINDDSEWVKEDDELGIEFIKDISSNNTKVQPESGVDTGGIAGYSKGVIIRCNNNGVVGYEHTGYNIGGIAGRQTGLVTLCNNNGVVYGRKDIGGIVGQIEPHIVMNEAESVRAAIDDLHDKIQKTLNDLTKGKNVVKSDMDSLVDYANQAIDYGDVLVDQITDYVDTNTENANEALDRVDNVIEMLPAVINQFQAANENMKGLNDVVKQMREHLNLDDRVEDTIYDEREYSRVVLSSSVGGSLTTNTSNPEKDYIVSINVNADNGYAIDSFKIVDINGKEIKTTEPANIKEIIGKSTAICKFKMPIENVEVLASFKYVGILMPASAPGGNVTVSEMDNGKVKITSEAYTGYSRGELTIGSQSVALNANGEVVVDKATYLKDGKPVLVYGKFIKNAASYKIKLESTTGGTVTTDSQAASAGDTVKVRITTQNKYVLGSLSGSGVSFTQTANAGEYSFVMPASDVTVTATFKYDVANNRDTVFYAESTVGGTVAVTKSLNDQDAYYVNIAPNIGYKIDNATVLQIYANNNFTTPVKQVSSTDTNFKDNENGTYRYVIKASEYPVKPVMVYGRFVKDGSNAGEHDIICVGGTGGMVSADTTSAVAGSSIKVASVANNGYKIKELKITNEVDNSEVKYVMENSTYTFTMPSADVRITAEYEPIQVIMTSNIGGSAVLSGKNDKVILTVKPQKGYSVTGTPTVKGANGQNIALGKGGAGSWTYEFKLSDNQKPATAVITFGKQNQKESASSALDRIDANLGTLQGMSENIQLRVNDIQSMIYDKDGKVRQWSDLKLDEKNRMIKDVVDIMEYASISVVSASELMGDLSLVYNIYSPYIEDMSKDLKADFDKATAITEQVLNNLTEAGNKVSAIVDYLNSQSEIQLSELGDKFDTDADMFKECLKGMTNSLSNFSDHASKYSDIITNDLMAVNDQMNLVFNLLLDKADDYSDPKVENVYTEITDDEIATTTNGKVEACVNKALVSGDIDVGGIAGSMSIDTEDPEENAAGNIEFRIGRKYIGACVISKSINNGYVLAKKDGAGGIVGYMFCGAVADSTSYGKISSTDGDYVGGICGQSLATIRRCYALCTISGNKNVGGITGYATKLEKCYAMPNIMSATGRFGAVAGQVAIDEDDPEKQEVKNNYYVADNFYGIDDISYIGVAEPVTYNELLTMEGVPNDFRHMKVTYMVDDSIIGTQELEYGESVEKLKLPDIPYKEGFFGVWNDIDVDKINSCLIVEAEYRDDVKVLQSNDKASEDLDNISEDTKLPIERSTVLAEGIFTNDAELIVENGTQAPPADIENREYVIYNVQIKNSGITSGSNTALRLLNPYEDATVYCLQNGKWTPVESKVRGQYLQVNLRGDEGSYCVVNNDNGMKRIIIMVAGAIGGIILIIIVVTIIAKIHKKKKERAGKKRVVKKKKDKTSEENEDKE